MNLALHGCVGITAANMLCDCGLVSTATFVASRNDAGDLAFEAIEMELLATVEIGRISQAGAATPPLHHRSLRTNAGRPVRHAQACRVRLRLRLPFAMRA